MGVAAVRLLRGVLFAGGASILRTSLHERAHRRQLSSRAALHQDHSRAAPSAAAAGVLLPTLPEPGESGV